MSFVVFFFRAMALIMEDLVEDYINGDKKVSVIEYGTNILMELEVEN